MADIVERLEAKITRHVLSSMPAEATFLQKLNLGDLLIEYRTWRGAFIAPVARRVHLSKELRGSDKAVEHEQILDSIVAKIEAGEDINSHLSNVVQRVPRPQKSGQSRRDLLLSEWGIHHLHLSEEMTGDGFVKRGDDVLFVVFRDQDAYLIGIYGHPGSENWAAEAIFAVIVHNWPAAGLVQEMKGVVGLSQEYSDEDREKLRKAGVQTSMMVDGKVYVPATIGQTTAGTPIMATVEANKLIWALRGWKEDPDERLRNVEGVEPEAYWIPKVRCPVPGFEEYCGFEARSVFVTVGRIC
jgi:hypothetical protein